MFKKIISLTVCTISLTLSLQTTAAKYDKKLTIIDNDKSNYAILIKRHCLDSVLAAAKELQHLSEDIYGVKLPIQYQPSGKHKYIVIGQQPLAAKNGINPAKQPKDSFVIRAKNGNIFLIGQDYKIQKSRNFITWSNFMESDSIGSYFAVMEFARQFMGVEWYMPGANGVAWQPQKRLAVPANLNIYETPHFQNRFIEGVRCRYESSVKSLVKSGMLRHNYFNAKINRECMQWGRRMLLGNNKLVYFNHAWWRFMPPRTGTPRSGGKAYGKNHPEYYALRNGVRQNFHRHAHYGAQLCLSNPAVAKTYADNIIAYGKKTGETTFSMSENDGGGQCECRRCRALDGKDPVTGEAVISNRLLHFANQVARLVAAKIPAVRLGIYAYNATLHPPVGKVKIDSHLYISDVYNYLPNLWYSSAAERNKLIGYMKKWRQCASHVDLTSYYNIYGNWGLPWDTTEVTGKTIKILGNFKSSRGLTLCNCRYFGISPGVDGARLWVAARLMWNPNQDIAKLRDQYYRGAFGPEAGRYIKNYFDTINRSAIRVMQRNPINIETDNTALQCTFPEKIYAPIRRQCRQLINKALAASAHSNERIRWRVSRVALAWKFTELTIASALYAKMARTGAYVDSGLTLAQTWERAVEAGKLRRKMLNSPDSYYAMAQGSADYCQVQRPIGIVEKIPENIKLDIGVPLIKDKFVIDGKLDDKVWHQIPPTRDFLNNANGKAMPIKTWAKIFRTDSAFVIGFYCAEPHMDKLEPQSNPNTIWNGDVAELYISRTGTQMNFVQFLANAISTKRAFIMRGDRGLDNNWHPDWQAKGYKGKNYWSVEMLIPFKTLGIKDNRVTDKTFFVNFNRERYAAGSSQLYAWSPTHGGFAQPAKFGRMNFTTAAISSKQKSNIKNAKNLLPPISPAMRGWDITRIGDIKHWATTSKSIKSGNMVKKDAAGNYCFEVKDNHPPTVYVLHTQKPLAVKPGDRFRLFITYKRDLISYKRHRSLLKSPYIRVSFDQPNRGKKSIWFSSTTTVPKLNNWHTDEHKIYLDPAGKMTKMWIKLSLFGENNTIKSIKLIKL